MIKYVGHESQLYGVEEHRLCGGKGDGMRLFEVNNGRGVMFTINADRCGDMDLEMVKEFFYAVSYSAGMNLHFKVLSGSNNHHIVEAMFKAFAKALDSATMIDERIVGVLSTKETL